MYDRNGFYTKEKTMKLAPFLISLSLLTSSPTLAMDGGVDAGSVVSSSVTSTDSQSLTKDQEQVLDNTIGSMKEFYVAAKEGNWAAAMMFLLFMVVGFLRTLGKKIHSWLPDNNVLDKPLIFLYDTKPGGWLLNWLTAIGGCLVTAYLAGMPVDFHAWRTALIASTGGTALIELKDDIVEWWENRKDRRIK